MDSLTFTDCLKLSVVGITFAWTSWQAIKVIKLLASNFLAKIKQHRN